MEQITCKDCVHRPIFNGKKVVPPQNIYGKDDMVCPFLCDDGYYNRMPADYFFCFSGEKCKFAILAKDMTMPCSCDKCPFFDNMVDGICSLLHKEYNLKEIGLRMRECPLAVVEEKEIGGQKVFIEVAGKEND